LNNELKNLEEEKRTINDTKNHLIEKNEEIIKLKDIITNCK